MNPIIIPSPVQAGAAACAEAAAEPFFVRALVQPFKSDAALVASISAQARLNRKKRGELAAVLAGLRRDGLAVARVQGLALRGGGATVAAVFSDGRAGLGVVLDDRPPADLDTVAAWCKADAQELAANGGKIEFLMIAIPAGLIAGALQ